MDEKFRPILRKLEDELTEAGLFVPAVVHGYFPAQSDDNDVIVYEPPKAQARPRGTRWEEGLSGTAALQVPAPERRAAACNLRLFCSEVVRQDGRSRFSLVTIGPAASAETQRLFEGGEYTKYLYLHGLSVETAEALAEFPHKKMREELGIGADDSSEIRDLFHQKHRGSRYSFGYPACPNLKDQTKLFALLKPEESVGVRLTAGFLLEPEQSTSAIVVHHPAAKYFVV